MAEKRPQNLANHVRFDPPFHFFVFPVLVASWIVSVVFCALHPSFWSFWLIVFATAMVVAGLKIRTYPIKLQDRVIRLEERLRLAGLLPDAMRPQIARLTEDQLIGLRFAADEEAPALVEQALAGNFARKEIKQAIKTWRPDYWRV